jgi:hypothetical protein
MADIERRTPVALSLKRAEHRTAELTYAITRLEVRKMELSLELSGIDETLEGTKKTLDEHLEASKDIK